MSKFTPPKNSKKVTVDIASLEAEKRELYKSGKNPERLKKVIVDLDWIYFGIREK